SKPKILNESTNIIHEQVTTNTKNKVTASQIKEITTYLKTKKNLSYRGFLVFCRKMIVDSVFSDNWRELDRHWCSTFIKYARKVLNKETLKNLKTKNGVFWSTAREITGFLTLVTTRVLLDPGAPTLLLERSNDSKRGVNSERVNDGTATTKSSTARTPLPVKLWCSFINEVNSYEVNDDDEIYPCPTFKKYNNPYDISNEEDVRGALKNNVFDNLHLITTSKRPIEVFKRISIEDEVKGEPDFIYKRIGKLLLPIEVKTQWVLFIQNELLHERYNRDLEKKTDDFVPQDNTISVVNFIHQIFGYLVANKLQFGILTTYNQH
ncbi:10425_t:CDS:2, partial [Racocetra persica]